MSKEILIAEGEIYIGERSLIDFPYEPYKEAFVVIARDISNSVQPGVRKGKLVLILEEVPDD